MGEQHGLRSPSSWTRQEMSGGSEMKTRTDFLCALAVAACMGAAILLSGCASNVGPGPSFDSTSWSPTPTTVDASPDAASPYVSSPQVGPSGTSGGGTKTRITGHKKTSKSIEAFYEDVELDEIEIGGLDDDDDSLKVHDITRKRAGVGMSFGSDVAQGYFRVFYEEFGKEMLNEPFRGGGVGGGVKGIPKLAEFNDNISLILPYRGGVDFVYGQGEIDVYEIQGGTPTYLGTADVNTLYVDLQGSVGIGVDIHGFQPSVGLAFDGLIGTMKVDDTVGQYDIDDDEDISAFNVGGFAELRYKHPDFPVFASVRGLFGNIDGFAVSLGVDF